MALRLTYTHVEVRCTPQIESDIKFAELDKFLFLYW
jgi:hypothetical protein